MADDADMTVVLENLRARCAAAEEERARVSALLKGASDALDALKERPVARPEFRSVAEINARIAELETLQSTSSRSLSEEKKLIAAIKTARAAKGDVAAYDAWNARTNEAYARRKALRDELSDVINRSREMQAGLHRVEIVARLNAGGADVAVGDIVEEEFEVPEAVVGRIVGKGGAARRALEEACAVSIDVQRKEAPGGGAGGKRGGGGGTAGGDGGVRVRVLGTPDCIARARARIADSVAEREVEVRLPGGLRSWLVSRSGENVRALEERHGVHVTIEKVERPERPAKGAPQPPRGPPPAGVASIRGGPAAIADATAELDAIRAARRVLPSGDRGARAVVGEKGATIRRIFEETGVAPEIDDVKGTIELWGPPDAVAAAEKAVLAVIDENTEHMVAVPIPPEMVGYVLENKAARLNAFIDAHKAANRGLWVRVRFGGEGEGGGDALEVKGTRAVLDQVLPLVEAELCDRFRQSRVVFPVPRTLARALLGNGGVALQGMRKESGAGVDVDFPGERRRGGPPGRRGQESKTAGAEKEAEAAPAPTKRAAAAPTAADATITVQSDDSVNLARGIACVKAYMALFRTEALTLTSGQFGAFIGKGGEGIRAIETSTGAHFSTDRESGAVIVAGTSEAVAAGAAAVREIIEANAELEVPCSADGVAVKGKSGEKIKALEAETGVSIQYHAGTQVLLLRGSAEKVAAAGERVRAFVEQAAKEALVMSVPLEDVSALIGKGGAQIKKLEEASGATIDVESKTGRVTLRGGEELIEKARLAIREVLFMDKHSQSVAVPEAAIGALFGKAGDRMKKLEASHGVTVALNRGAGTFIIRGEEPAVLKAKAALLERLREALFERAEVSVPAEKMRTVVGKGGANIRMLQEETGAIIDAPRRGDDSEARVSTVRLRGEPDAVAVARARILAIVAGQASAGLRLSEAHYGTLKASGSRNVERIRGSSGADITLVDGARAVSIVGSEAAVAAAATALDQCLCFMLGAEYGLVPVPAGLVNRLSEAGLTRAAPRGAGAGTAVHAAAAAAAGEAGDDDAAAAAAAPAAPGDASLLLQSVADRSGATVWVRRNVPHATVCGPAGAVAAARALLEEEAAAEAALLGSVPIEEWMAPAIIGKKGAAISALSKRAGVELNLERDRNTLEFRGRTAAATAAAKTVIEEHVAALARGQCVLHVGGQGVGIVIGKGGANIRRVGEETKANVQCDRDSGTVTIRGSEEEVAAAKALIGQLLMTEGGIDITKPLPVLSVERVPVEAGQIPAVVGASGATIRGIEQSSGARLNVDRDKGCVVVTGTAAAVAAAVAEVRGVLAKVEADRATARSAAAARPVAAAAAAAAAGAQGDGSGDDAPAAAPARAGPYGAAPALSKAAQRNARRHERGRLEREAAAAAAVVEAVSAPAPAAARVAAPLAPAPARAALPTPVPVIAVAPPAPASPAPAPAAAAPKLVHQPVAAPAPHAPAREPPGLGAIGRGSSKGSGGGAAATAPGPVGSPGRAAAAAAAQQHVIDAVRAPTFGVVVPAAVADATAGGAPAIASPVRAAAHAEANGTSTPPRVPMRAPPGLFSPPPVPAPAAAGGVAAAGAAVDPLALLGVDRRAAAAGAGRGRGRGMAVGPAPGAVAGAGAAAAPRSQYYVSSSGLSVRLD